MIAFKNITARGLTVIGIKQRDQLGWVRISSSIDKVLISTRKGKTMLFKADNFQLRSTGRSSQGVRSMKIDIDDKIADLDIIPNFFEKSDSFVLMITSQGFGKRTLCKDFRTTNRGGKGVVGIKLRNDDLDYLVAMRYCKKDDEVLLSTIKGNILRQKIQAIALQGRTAMGVKVQKLIENDSVSKVSIIPENFSE